MVIYMQEWKEKTEKVQGRFKLHMDKFLQMCKENRKVITIAAVFLIAAMATVFFGGLLEKDSAETTSVQLEDSAARAGGVEEEVISVPEEALEKDAYPEINNLVKQYYQALVDGDMQTINSIKSQTDEQEEIKILKKSEFIENYPAITVYTKKGPAEGSFVAYVHYEVKFLDYEGTAPGLNTLYICSREDGTYYINDSDLEEADIEYLKTVSAQNDVIDLFNTVQVQYNEVKTSNAELSAFLDELPNLLAESVSVAMAELEAEEEAENPEETVQEPTEVVVVTKVRTTDVVNVRSSDSIEADKIGKTTKGQVLDLIEERVNGWSKVVFEGQEGFVKSEYLEPEETTVVTQEPEGAEENAGEETAEETTVTEGKVTDTVNVRETPSTEGNKLGKISAGSTIQIIEKQSDGWTKIQYEGKEAYVKSDYVE